MLFSEWPLLISAKGCCNKHLLEIFFVGQNGATHIVMELNVKSYLKTISCPLVQVLDNVWTIEVMSPVEWSLIVFKYSALVACLSESII